MAVGARSAGCLATYVADGRRYDELLDERGAVRQHWRPLIDKVAAEDGTGAGRRGLELTRRLIIENGVTYNVYADPQGADRPWGLDPLPLVLTAEEWGAIEAGVAQRATLLNALLADLYGPQRLLAEGIVPTELPFGHPNFLWPCHGVTPASGDWLHVYAVDLARAPDGRWWVLSDRTQAPSGAGYALENREIVEQVLPDSIRDLGVRRVRGFFGNLRERLLAGVADTNEKPLAVLLTPGPFNETYFEHAYLAGQLGLPLAEGTDLTVRGETVYLKTLGGLRRVHAILRRLDDDFCDPVELRSDSALGVPGLLSAVRAGRVVVGNALGTGVLESAAWLGFLPGISQRLRGEELMLPAVATWWCGEPPALDYVLSHLDELVIKPAYPNQHFEPVFGRDLTRETKPALVARLRARPYAYVAQEHMALSQAPVWRQNGSLGLSARALAIRVYAVATDRGYRVMPGGLGRVSSDAAADVVSSQRGGGSKDIWVISSESADESKTSAGEVRPPLLVRQDDIPSRVVENLFWLGRYAVRCEDKSRLIRSTLAVRVDAGSWRLAVKFCRDLGFVGPSLDPSESLRDEQSPQGIVADVKRLAWCASQVRSRLSGSYWRVVLDIQRQLQRASIARGEPREALDRLVLSLSALAGFAFDDMTHDEGWRLMRVGRRLERLQFLSTMLAQYLESSTPARPNHVEWLLEACDSLVIYRSRYVSVPRLGPALDLLIRDIQHPRALAFQSEAIGRDLATLAASLGGQAVEGLGNAMPYLEEAALFAMEADSVAAVEERQTLAHRLRELALAAGSAVGSRFHAPFLSHGRGRSCTGDLKAGGMRYHVKHETSYAYGSDVVLSHQLLHLVPRPSPFQVCLEHSISIDPPAFERRDETDAFGNIVTRVELEHAHRRLDVTAELEVDVHARPAVAAAHTLPWELVRDSLSYKSGRWPARDVLDACRFRHESPYIRVKQAFDDFGAECFTPGRPVLACAEALMQKIHRELKYSPGETSIATPLAEVLEQRRGVCQDFAHLMIACLRSRGLAARYVSGYIRLRPAVTSADLGKAVPASPAIQPTRLIQPQMDWVGAGASHAWVSVYSPPFGWLELDPTNNVHVGTDHIAVAWGRDFGDVSPLRGVILGGGSHVLSVSVVVEPKELQTRPPSHA